MDLAPEQYFVYAWRYTDDTVCKLGVGTLRSFYARIKAAKTVTYQDIELLGIEVFGTETEARTAYQQRLKTFARVVDRRAWVHFDDCCPAVDWQPNACRTLRPSMLSRMPFRMIPCAVKRNGGINNAGLRKAARRGNVKQRKSSKKRTEKDRAYEREYARKRRENDPAYKEKQKAASEGVEIEEPGL